MYVVHMLYMYYDMNVLNVPLKPGSQGKYRPFKSKNTGLKFQSTNSNLKGCCVIPHQENLWQMSVF